jgi:4'-phosphopantetheinyl transferase
VPIGPGEVQVEDWQTLSDAEQAKANSYRFERDTTRFARARVVLKRILAKYLGTMPDSVSFRYNEFGKPYLPIEAASSLQFNLSHSHDLAVIAVCNDVEIGIDVEYPTDLEYLDVARHFFAEAEIHFLRTRAQDLREGFFRIWTRKEACVKAVGSGLSIPLDGFDVLADTALPAGQQCRLMSWRPAGGYHAAVATLGQWGNISHFTLPTAM